LNIILPSGRQCKNRVGDNREIYCKQCKEEVEEREEIERSNNEAHEEALNFDPSQIIKLGKPFTLNAMKPIFG